MGNYFHVEDRSELRPIGDPHPDRPQLHGPEHGEAAVHAAASLLVKFLFTPQPRRLEQVEYAVEYSLAQGEVGGDIVDAYLFDNGSIAFSVSDISDKGPRAALHAALIKFSLRAYASQGATPETTIQNLNTLYMENSLHEERASYATSFFAHIDNERHVMGYASAAHDTVVLMHPDEPAIPLPVTAPMIGVFDTQKHAFRQRYVELQHGTVLVAVTDGVTDARRGDVEFFGMDRLRQLTEGLRSRPMTELAARIMDEAKAFWGEDRARDDMAVLAVRFL